MDFNKGFNQMCFFIFICFILRIFHWNIRGTLMGVSNRERGLVWGERNVHESME
jgi:hypothetical protein